MATPAEARSRSRSGHLQDSSLLSSLQPRVMTRYEADEFRTKRQVTALSGIGRTPVLDLCRDRVLVRYGVVRTSAFGILRATGFALLPSLRRPHFSIVLPELGTATLDRLDSCFGAPVPNPGRTL